VGSTTHPTDGTITSLLDLMRAGDKPAADRLFDRVYDELRAIARAAIRGCGGKKPVEGTALVHAACERLLRREQLDANNRAHFFFILSRAMRDVLIDEARASNAVKRGGNSKQFALADFQIPDGSKTIEFLELHEAIEELRHVDENCAAIVTLRFFGGRTLEEAAACMSCTVGMARRHWAYARAWLHKRLSK
jgi:RNA polymerase sigma factor (TIGR02999 family)